MSSPEQLLQNGLARRREGKLREAQSLLLQAVTQKPELFDAALELGQIYRELGDLEAATMCFEQCTDLEPGSFTAQLELGRTLVLRNRPDLAVGHYQCALLLGPEQLDVLHELAALYYRMRRSEPALLLYRRALELAPERAALRRGLASALHRTHEPDAAIREFQRALELEPDSALTYTCLAGALFDLGRMSETVAAYEKSLVLAPDATAHGNLMYTLMYDPASTQERIFELASSFDRRYVQPLAAAAQGHRRDRNPERRLRIGYVSPDFRNHCQAFFTTPLFTYHDRRQVEVHGFALVERADAVTEQLKTKVDAWHDVRTQNDVTLAQTIRNHEIDILVDLTMHMSDSRPLLFARKPAPLQVCWLAYPGTTGNSAIDYRITDRHIDPPGLFDRFYMERSLRLPDTFWCYDPLSEGPAVGPLPMLGRGHVTLGCLNAFGKTNRTTFALWARVLRALPSSRLMLLTPPGETREQTAAIFESEGVERHRLDLLDRRPREKYLELYRELDICLDTVPYNGHTTSLDAAWMAVPVVTLVGSTVVGRAGLCLAENLGLPELVAHTPDEFVERALALAAVPERLRELRAGLRARLQASALMDGQRFAHNLEVLFRAIWREWCSQAGEDRPR